MKNKIETIRKEKGILQEEFAKAMGVSRQTISSLENGRYNPSILLAYKIAKFFEMTIEEGLEFFDGLPKLRKKLETLNDVGLGYIKIGQPATTISGGEAQRVKLSTELSKRATGRTVYILDEPTTGLHFHDINKLLKAFDALLKRGHTIVIIEHNMDVIKCADWIVDLGPEAGSGGGRVVFEGTPEQIVTAPESYTGKYLALRNKSN